MCVYVCVSAYVCVSNVFTCSILKLQLLSLFRSICYDMLIKSEEFALDHLNQFHRLLLQHRQHRRHHHVTIYGTCKMLTRYAYKNDFISQSTEK